MLERLLGAAAGGAALGEAVLFFGCRRADQDFLYGEQLQAWARDGHLTLFTAFSRQQVGRPRGPPRRCSRPPWCLPPSCIRAVHAWRSAAAAAGVLVACMRMRLRGFGWHAPLPCSGRPWYTCWGRGRRPVCREAGRHKVPAAAWGVGAERERAARRQARKVYVQDRVRESGDLLWRLLATGAHVYVCGDAAGMAPAVEQALLDVIARAQGSGRPAAQQLLQQLADAGRYQRDVWF